MINNKSLKYLFLFFNKKTCIILSLTIVFFFFRFYFDKKYLLNTFEKNIKRKEYFNSSEQEENLCKNFGIFIYNYPFDKPKPKYGNIGDYIQSLAALQFLPKNCSPKFIDRDSFQFYKGENITVIMNGWYRIFNGNKLIPKNLSPIYLSIHITNVNNLDSKAINNLKKYQPIGCRDMYTFNGLKKYKIDTYFSSCLTTTLDIDYSVNETEKTNEIIFNDYSFGYNSKIDNYIRSLSSYDFNNIVYTTHFFNMDLSHFERFKIARNLIFKYAKAKLVITSRIHCALPCLALNTPFIFVNKDYNIRYDGLYEFFNTVGINSSKQFNINVRLDENNFVINPTKYLKYSKKLKEIFKKLSF